MTTRTAVQQRDLVSSLYDVATHARRFQERDPVDTGAVRLLYLVQAMGPARPSSVATAARLDLSTVSRHLRELEQRGYVRRSPDPDDGRAARFEVTAAGASAVHDVLDNRVAALGPVLDRWSAGDRDTLARLLRRLADDLAAEHCGTRPTTGDPA
jgi:DNA-binding MarR family transcriptional regulator